MSQRGKFEYKSFFSRPHPAVSESELADFLFPASRELISCARKELNYMAKPKIFQYFSLLLLNDTMDLFCSG